MTQKNHEQDEIDYILPQNISQYLLSKQADEDDDEDYINEGSIDFSSFENKSTVEIRKYDPKTKFYCVDAGINLKGKCNNKNCESNQNGYVGIVWIQRGFGNFQLGKMKCFNKCPCCQQKIQGNTIKTLGITRASVSFKGAREVDCQDVQFQRTQVEKEGKFLQFSDANEDIVRWSYLDLVVTKV